MMKEFDNVKTKFEGKTITDEQFEQIEGINNVWVEIQGFSGIDGTSRNFTAYLVKDMDSGINDEDNIIDEFEFYTK